MCGIAGIVSSEAIADSCATQLTESLSHRGPDSVGIYRYQSTNMHVLLVHTRLSIIDIAGGNQPLHSKDSSYHAVINGELYNYRDLQLQLQAEGRVFATTSDSEVFMQSYAHWGEAALQKYHGMYAAALFDEQSQKLVLIRDRLGIKPLYYLTRQNKFYFSSEIYPLVPYSAKHVQQTAVAEYFLSQVSCGSNTAISGIKRLEPGYYIVRNQDHSHTHKRYWQCQASSLETNPTDTHNLLQNAILEHTASDVPLAAYISGGVDSGLLASLLSEYDNNLSTLSIRFDTNGASEADLAASLAKKIGSKHYEQTLTSNSLYQRLAFVFSSSDELMRDFASIPLSYLAETSKNLGLKIAFCGEGGDEVFAGYGRLLKPALLRNFLHILYPGTYGYRLKSQIPLPILTKIIPNAQLAFEQIQERHIQTIREAKSLGFHTPLQCLQYLELTQYLPNQLLTKTDRVLMRFGVEGRVPLLDHNLVAHGLSLPSDAKVHSRSGKQVLREIFSSYVPKHHVTMPKKGFTVPLVDLAEKMLANGLIAKLRSHSFLRDYCNMNNIETTVKTMPAKPRYRLLFSLIHLALWHDHLIDRRPLCGKNSDPLRLL